MNRRGAALLQVLVFGAIVAVVAASLLRMTLMSQTVSARSLGTAQGVRSTEGALATLLNAWNASGTCANVPGLYTCAAVGPCGCDCTPTASGQPTVKARAVPAGCPQVTLEITSP
ncbi:MAG: hypothetical protein HY552_05650 [Elusimicrobia bacterium]|nr:hypothetical protein [Elusimicrobiota bacterium]